MLSENTPQMIPWLPTLATPCTPCPNIILFLSPKQRDGKRVPFRLDIWYNSQKVKRRWARVEKYDQAVSLWKRYKIISASDLDKYLDSFRVLFAFHSGRIENESITYQDTRGIFENSRVLNYTGNPRALFEQQNQKLCHEFLKERIISKEPLSIFLVKEIHRILTGGTTMIAGISPTGNAQGSSKSMIMSPAFMKWVPPQKLWKAIWRN